MRFDKDYWFQCGFSIYGEICLDMIGSDLILQKTTTKRIHLICDVLDIPHTTKEKKAQLLDLIFDFLANSSPEEVLTRWKAYVESHPGITSGLFPSSSTPTPTGTSSSSPPAFTPSSVTPPMLPVPTPTPTSTPTPEGSTTVTAHSSLPSSRRSGSRTTPVNSVGVSGTFNPSISIGGLQQTGSNNSNVNTINNNNNNTANDNQVDIDFDYESDLFSEEEPVRPPSVPEARTSTKKFIPQLHKPLKSIIDPEYDISNLTDGQSRENCSEEVFDYLLDGDFFDTNIPRNVIKHIDEAYPFYEEYPRKVPAFDAVEREYLTASDRYFDHLLVTISSKLLKIGSPLIHLYESIKDEKDRYGDPYGDMNAIRPYMRDAFVYL